MGFVKYTNFFFFWKRMEIFKIQTPIYEEACEFQKWLKKSNNWRNKRKRYTNVQKLEVVEYKEKNPNTAADTLIM